MTQPGAEQPDAKPPGRSSRRETLLLATAALIGVLLVTGGWLMQGGSYLPGLMLQVGSELMLVVPLLLLGRLLEARLRRTEERARSISTSLTDMRARIDQAAVRLDELGTLTRQRIARQREEDIQAAHAADERLSRASLARLLDRATSTQAVATAGARVHIPSTALWLRFAITPDGPEKVTLTVTVENRAGTPAAALTWAEGASPDTMAHRLADELLALGEYPGEQSFDASELFRGLVHTIQLGLERRDRPPGQGLGPLVELVNDQWAIATDGMYSLSRPYHIPADRLTGTSEDWDSHMAGKPWVDPEKFSDAYRTTVELFRASRL